MDAIAIIEKHYDPESRAFHLLIHHSRMVAEKALKIARRVAHLDPDPAFVQEAAMLHDIGMFLTREPALGCYGEKPYLCHGVLGRELLEREGFPRHALVCERHVGVGISLGDIEKMDLPLPARDMLPLSIEEQIVCYADKFFSKDAEFLLKEKSLEKIRSGIAGFGEHKLRRFDEWLEVFGA